MCYMLVTHLPHRSHEINLREIIYFLGIIYTQEIYFLLKKVKIAITEQTNHEGWFNIVELILKDILRQFLFNNDLTTYRLTMKRSFLFVNKNHAVWNRVLVILVLFALITETYKSLGWTLILIVISSLCPRLTGVLWLIVILQDPCGIFPSRLISI